MYRTGIGKGAITIQTVGNYCDTLIYAVKDREVFANCKFFRSFQGEIISSPLVGTEIYCEIGKVSKKSRFLNKSVNEHTGEFIITVYAASEKYKLTYITASLMTALLEADSENYIEEISAEPLTYSDSNAAVYRKIKAVIKIEEGRK